MGGWNSAMPYDYLLHMVNSSSLSDQGQTSAPFRNYHKRRSQLVIAMRFSLKFLFTMGGTAEMYMA